MRLTLIGKDPKLLKLHELGCELNFQGVSDRTFNCNLQLIDSFLPKSLVTSCTTTIAVMDQVCRNFWSY